MGIDAVALLRPKRRDVLRKHAEHLIPLEDGSVLFLTLMRYRDFEDDPAKARAFLESELGCALGKVQDDARGVLMFADVAEPSATTYDGVVVEIGEDGLWVPLDDSPAARARAARASAAVKRPSRGGRENPFSSFGSREIPTDAPLFSGDVGQLEQLAGSFVRIAPDTEVWCLLVRRTTPLPSEPLAQMTRGSVVLADKTTAIHAKYMESLDAVTARLSNEYAEWIGEHDDPRGVPVFRFGAFHRVREASSYADALARLGADVRWVVVKPRTETKPAKTKPANTKAAKTKAAKTKAAKTKAAKTKAAKTKPAKAKAAKAKAAKAKAAKAKAAKAKGARTKPAKSRRS